MTIGAEVNKWVCRFCGKPMASDEWVMTRIKWRTKKRFFGRWESEAIIAHKKCLKENVK